MISEFSWFARSLLKDGDWGFALHVEAHFDESGTDAKEMTLAGYLFEQARIDEFCEKWNAELKKFDLPFFHMVDCAHLAKPFDQLSRSESIRLQMKLMRLIKRFSISGIVCNIQNAKDNKGQTYEKVVQKALCLVSDWADASAFGGKIAYFFEAGDGQGGANEWLNQVSQNPTLSTTHRYAGHAFLPKAGNPGVQAADLLAWQYHNFTKKRDKATLARLDLRALLRHPHMITDDCGELPRKSRSQSIEQSRTSIETVYYLPSVKEEDTHGRSVIVLCKDSTFMIQDNATIILACPNCFRAIGEGTKFEFRNVIFQCYCKTYCDTPDTLPPFNRAFYSFGL